MDPAVAAPAEGAAAIARPGSASAGKTGMSGWSRRSRRTTEPPTAMASATAACAASELHPARRRLRSLGACGRPSASATTPASPSWLPERSRLSRAQLNARFSPRPINAPTSAASSRTACVSSGFASASVAGSTSAAAPSPSASSSAGRSSDVSSGFGLAGW
eukprot:scaffold7401_cov108-Isochrysis_galbana.AAC.4